MDIMKKPQLSEKGSSASFEKAADFIDVDGIAAEIQAIPEELIEAAEYAQTMNSAEIEAIIHRIVDEHGDDPNFPPAVLDAAKCVVRLPISTHTYVEANPTPSRYLFDADIKESPVEYHRLYDELKVEAALIAINSPYTEVRAVVDNHDDPSVPANTFRTWVIGTIFVGVGYPGIGVGPNVAQILAVPFAKLMELLPNTEFTTFGYNWSLNPGPFSPKEHMLITIMANVGFSTPYTYIIWVQYLPLYFNQSWALGFGYQILVALSTNLIGYGLAGLTRRFLVYPASAIWWRAFHNEKNTVVNGWRVSKLRWFLYCFCAMFVYFWFPDFIFQSLQIFNWPTWINPTSVSLAAITGSFSGLGLNPWPTFDYNLVTASVDPLIVPFFGLVTLPIIAALWYTNSWNTGYLPINSNLVFDNTGDLYAVGNVVGSDTMFNQTMYESYSPAYLSASNALLYGVFFAIYIATLSHAFLYHRREIVHGFKSILSRQKTSHVHRDVHVRLMESYKEVPEWQVLVFAIVVGAVGIGIYPTNTSPAVSITNVEIGLNVLAELFGGLWFPGNAVAMNYFKSYGYVTTAQTIAFASDLKLAHYMHIPPVLTFYAQIYATVISSFVCTAILNFQMTKIPDVCTPHQVNHFTCPGINTFFTARWGTLGPKRMFGAGGIYNNLLWCFLIGAILPIPVYFLRKKVKVFEYFHLPIFLVGGLNWAPYNLSFIWPAVPVGYVFNVFIRRRYLAWWSKYNYVTTTAFTAAIAIAGIVIFFAIEWPAVEIDWRGNTRPIEGCDYNGCPRLELPDKGFFGPVRVPIHCAATVRC
ncbi:OPT-domain-containing protein [Mycena crocata]|nr:OPT-domain-containing protein [Mycena crocata]